MPVLMTPATPTSTRPGAAIVADYAGEWACFQDWCAAVDRTALPASPETVLQYLEEEQPAGGTAARWIAGIRAAHQAAGLPDPCYGPVTMWVRRARNGLPTDAESAAATLREPARSLPTTGWPTGVFGRRDRLAFLLHQRAAIPAHTLLAIQTGDVTVRAGMITVKTGETSVPVVEPHEDRAGPMVCAACAVLRWWWILTHVAGNTHRQMATSISKATPRSDHVCANATVLSARVAPPAEWPLFPAVDRWGNLPTEPVPAMSLRAMQQVLRDVARQQWAHATIRVPAPVDDGQPQPQPAPAAATPAPKLPLSPQQDGVAARAEAQAALADVTDRLEEFTAGVDDLDKRINQLLADHTDPD
jgi:hypothetical protein